MKIAYFDCFSGISGNMVLGALLDAGLEVERLKRELDHLSLPGYTLTAETVRRSGLRGTYVQVQVSEHEHERHLRDIARIVEGSDLPQEIKSRGLSIFHHLADAEARVHGISVDQVHFHEVGAVDAIVDIMGTVIGLWLLDVEKVYASPVHVGRGTVECAHGTLPVPAPATLELLRGVPTYGREVEAELVTPTGAAILAALVESFDRAPRMRVDQVGYGAGRRELPHPNLLRVSVGTLAEKATGYEEDTVTVIETNIDDMTPEWYEHVMERLFEVGALDVFLTPIQMKRSRPGVQLNVLLPEERVPDVLPILFAETTTIGVRLHRKRRYKLRRDIVTVKTRYGPIDVKVARAGERLMNVAPEYRDCRRAAKEHGTPLKKVHQAALSAAYAEHG
jgi:hypothetical protein